MYVLTCGLHGPVLLQAGIASGALASAAVGATNVAGTLIATSLIEGAGRKQLLLSSYLGMAATMALMAAGFGLPALAGYRSGLRLIVDLFMYVSRPMQFTFTLYGLAEAASDRA
jgi:hypothetical protein